MSNAIFDRVVVGVDGTDAGYEACRQALRLATPGTRIDAVMVVHLADAVWTGFDAARVAAELEHDAHEALAEASAILGEHADTRFVNGEVAPSLLRELRRVTATLVVVGSHGHHRATEILLGGVSGELLHAAPCAVLIARPPRDPETFPRKIVCGTDGSPPAELGLASARQLAARFEAELAIVEALDDRPVDALVAASRSADIVVVGSRGLHGLRALGSVSERVAHQAACSVLVVRAPPAT